MTVSDLAPSDETVLVASPPSDRQPLGKLALLSALMALGPLCTDLYLPALPAIALALHASAGTVDWTISGYLIGFSFGQLLWGPIGDRFGRKGPVLAGLLLFALGAAGCALSTSAGVMIGWRVVQALGACSGMVLSRAMVRDLYSGARAAQMLSTLITVMAIAPLVGPLLGSEILRLSEWSSIFWLLVAISVVVFAAVLSLRETLPAERRRRGGLADALRGYVHLIGNGQIRGYIAAGACFYFGVFAYIAGAPFAYMEHYGLTPRVFGLVFGCGIIGIMAANMINARIVGRWGIVPLLRVGATLAALSGLWAAVAAWTGLGGLPGLVAPIFVYTATSGVIVANSVAGAMTMSPRRAGSVSALVGALHYGAGIAGSGLLGFLSDGTPRPLGSLIAFAGLATAACAWFVVRPPRESSLG